LNTIEQFYQDLGKVLADITASPYASIEAGTMDKLGALSSVAATLKLNFGKQLIDNLSDSIKSLQAGNSDEKSVSLRVTALDFYQQNTAKGQGEALIEDL
jgi:hypothetical protein